MVRAQVDVHSHQQFALMTAVIVGILIAVYLHVLRLGDRADLFLQTYGAVPARVLPMLSWRHPYRALDGLQTVLTSIFLHANWLQLAANVTLLLLFGPNVEERLGHYRFLLLFVCAGAAAELAQALLSPDSRVALVGAQGAVAGVGGACLAISPRGRIPSMVRGIEFPWALGPLAWLAIQVLLEVSHLPMPADVGRVGIGCVLLAYALGIALGPLYRYQRPVLLRG